MAKNKNFKRHLSINNQKEHRDRPMTVCTGCVHYRSMSYSSKDKLLTCHYILDSGHSRGCDAKTCYEQKIHYSEEPRLNSFNKLPGWTAKEDRKNGN